MNRRPDLRLDACALIAAIIASMPEFAAAQSLQSEPAHGAWRYGLSVYGYLPSLNATSSAPADSNGSSIGVSAEKIIDNLKFTLMGSFDAHNGQWGVFTDFVYLNLGGSKQQSRDFTLGGATPPAGTTADLDWDFKGSAWTLAGEYRVLADPTITMDALAGARRFDVRTTSRWSITGDLGPILPSGRAGSAESKVTLLDGIVGVKGRMAFGTPGPWSLPFYLDVGTGQSHLTWQALAGVSYAFKWGELTAAWRYLAYEMKPGKSIEDLNLNGPLIGATWRW